MKTAKATVKNHEIDLKSKVEQEGAACMDKAKHMASSVMDQAQDAASSMAHTVGDAAAAVRAKANTTAATVGSGMESLASSIRHNMPREGVLGAASSSVAESLESGGRYLQHQGLAGMAKDITDLIRRNPVSALLVGVGIGFVLAKVTTASSKHGN